MRATHRPVRQAVIARWLFCAVILFAGHIASAQEPVVEIHGGGLLIANGDTTPSSADLTDFGNVGVGSAVSNVFAVTNSGTDLLILTDDPAVALNGPHAADFSVVVQPLANIAAGEGSLLEIRFAPGGGSVRTASVSVANNDADETPYVFSIQGNGVLLPGIDNDGGADNFGDGSADLNGTLLSNGFGNATVRAYWGMTNGGTLRRDWTYSEDLGVVPEGPVSVNVTGVTPNAIHYYSFEAENEAGIAWAVATNFIIPAPVMEIFGNDLHIPDGDSTPLAADGTDYGPVAIGTNSDHVFVISNSGLATLVLSGNPPIEITGVHSSDFSVVTLPATNIAVDGVTNVTLRFAPSQPGGRTATVTIANSDYARDPYDFVVVGTAGDLPEVNNASGATAVTPESATLNGVLVTNGSGAAGVYVYWGPTDGGTDPALWEYTNYVGSFSVPGETFDVPAGGLSADSTYYYRARAVNAIGEIWADSTEAFITGEVWLETPDEFAWEEGPVSADVVIVRDATCTNADLVVTYQLGGTASNVADYVYLSGVATILAGQTSVAVTVTPEDDVIRLETNETVTLSILPGPYIAGSVVSGEVTIVDNDNWDGWPHRMLITFTGYTKSEKLIDFPALVVFSESIANFHYADFGSTADAADLMFSDESGSIPLDYEIEEWDTNGSSYIWVELPALTNDAAIWAYWGNTNRTTPPECRTNGAVWNSGYRGVWHLNDDLKDSTTNNNDGSNVGSGNADGVIADGQEVYEGGTHVNCGNDPSLADITNYLTAEIWLNLDTLGSGDSYDYIFGKNAGGNWNSGWSFNYAQDAGGSLSVYLNAGAYNQPTLSTPITTGQWEHFVAIYNMSTLSIYKNGDFATSRGWAAGPIGTTGDPLRMGDDGWGYGADGKFDEARVHAVVRSGDWIWATYRTQASNATFAAYQIVRTTAQPRSDPPENVTTTNVDALGTLMHPGSGQPTMMLFWGLADGSTNPSAWACTNVFAPHAGPVPALYTTNLSGLTPDTTYYYRYAATNPAGLAWAETNSVFITGQLTVDVPDSYAAERGPDTGTFTIRRPGSCTTEATTVHYETLGSAIEGTDYNALTGTVTIAAGQTSAAVVLTPIDDYAWDESDEHAVLSLLPGNYALGTPSTGTVTIVDDDEWRLWRNRARVLFPSYDRSDLLSNFPALLVLSNGAASFRFDELAYPDTGSDLRFADANGAELNYEIEDWNAGSACMVWVRIPGLTNNASVYMYWGNTNESSAPVYTTDGSTWNNGYRGVWHLNDDLLDSTANNNHGADYGSGDADGPVSGGQEVYNNESRIDFGNDSSLRNITEALTAEIWLNLDSLGDPDNYDYIFGKNAGGNWNSGWSFCYAQDFAGSLSVYLNAGTYNQPTLGTLITTGKWEHFTATYDMTNLFLYKDGKPAGRRYWTGPIGVTDEPLRVGDDAFGGYQLDTDGRFDEARVSAVARSADWVWASWATMASGASFYAWSPLVDTLDPELPDTTTAILRGEMVWTDEAPSDVYVLWGTNDAGTNILAWGNIIELGARDLGVFTTDVVVLQDTVYYYRCFASNQYRFYWSPEATEFVTSEFCLQGLDTLAAEDGPDTGSFEIFRGDARKDVEVKVEYVLSGDADNGIDYAELSGSVIFTQGMTSVVIAVTPIDDETWKEPDERVIVTLTHAGYVPGDPDQAVITIRENDKPHKWKYRMKITFTGYPGGPLTNFPALVVFNESLEDFYYSTFASPNGHDLRFTDGDETIILNHEIEEWNSNGNSYVWVQAPLFVSNVSVWAMWGDPLSIQPAFSTNGATWSEQYLGVWHLAETSGAAGSDSTAQSNPAGLENMNNNDWTNAGIVANCLNFDAVSNARAWVFLDEPESEITHSLWFLSRDPAGGRGLFGAQGGGYDRQLYMNQTNAAARLFDNQTIASTDRNVADGSWHYVVHAFGPSISGQKLYIDAVECASGSKAASDFMDQYALSIGYAQDAANDYMEGYIDEVRVSTIPRSADWITANWLMIGDPGSFSTFTPVEPWGGSVISIR